MISQTFTITVDPALTLARPGNQTYGIGQQVNLVLPEGNGGGDTKTYGLTATTSDGTLNAANLPNGLTFNADSRTLSGTPTTAGTYAMTWSVDDDHDSPVTQTFSIAVQPALTLDRPANRTYLTSQHVRLVLPEGNDGFGEKTWGLTATTSDGTLNAANLPNGLAFNADTRTLFGTPTAAGSYTMTWTADDDSVDSAVTQTFSITVMTAATLTMPGDQTYAVGRQISSLVLPAGSGGAGTTYGLTATTADGTLNANDLPNGLTFNANSRTLSGTPTATGTYTMTYTATSTSDTSSGTFILAVVPVLTLDGIENPPAHGTYQQVNLVLPEGNDGVGERTYGLTGTNTFRGQLNAQNLPDGMAFNADTRTLSGAPTFSGEYRMTYTVDDDSVDNPVMQTFLIVVELRLSLGVPGDQTYAGGRRISDLVLPEGSNGFGRKVYGLTATTSDGRLNANNLPFGMRFTRSTRTLSGTPTNVGTYTMTYSATDDSVDSPRTQTFRIDVLRALTLPELADRTYFAGEQVNLVLPEGNDGFGEKTYSLVATTSNGTVTDNLPDGLVLNGRTLSGAPTTPGSYTMSYWANDDSVSRSVWQGFRITVVPVLTLRRPADQTYAIGRQVNLVLPAGNNGRGPKTYGLTVTTSDGTLNAANLPDGLALNGRTLSGTPTALGTYSMTWTADDRSVDNPVTQTFSFTVVPVLTLDRPADQTYAGGQQISNLVLPEGNDGLGEKTYGLTATTSDGTLNADNLPNGLAFNADTRTLSGTPTAAGTYAMTYRAEDDSVDSALTQTFSILVPALMLAMPGDQTYGTGQQVNLVLPESSDGVGETTYSLTATTDDGRLNFGGVLPNGLSFNADTRTLSGAPATVGTYRMTYRADDSDSPVTQTFSITVVEALTLRQPWDRTYFAGQRVTLVLLRGDDGFGDRTYGLTATTTGGTLNAANLPDGMAFAADSRTLSGTPTTVGTYTMTYTVEDDSVDNAQMQTFSIEVAATPTLDRPEDQEYFTGRRVRLVLPEGSEGSGDRTWGLTATTSDGTINTDNLPDGLSFNADSRTLSGTPTAAGTYSMTYGVRYDGFDNAVTQTFSIGILPALALDVPQNQIYGTGQQVSLVLPEGSDGGGERTYGLTASTSDGTLNAQNLPNGLMFNTNSRTLSGVPTATGTYRMTYRADDDSVDSAVTRTFSIDILPALTLGALQDQMYFTGRQVTLVLPEGNNGGGDRTYGLTATTSDGTLNAQNLPAGLAFNANADSRILSGTPTVAGTYAMTYTADDDSVNNALTQSFRIEVVAALTLNMPEDRTYFAGQQVNLVLPAGRNGGGDRTWGLTATTSDGTLNAQDLPNGLAFNADSRTLSGTPTVAGTYAMTYTADDDSIDSALTQTFSIEVVATPTLAALADRTYFAGGQISLVLPEGSGGLSARTWGLTATTTDGALNTRDLPAGTSFNPRTRTLSGAPTTAGTYSMTYSTGYDSVDNAVAQTFSIAVVPVPMDIADQTWPAGQEVSLVLPEGDGGRGARTWGLTATTADGTLNAQDLPAGLLFNASSRTLSGTPTAEGTYAMTYRTDYDGADNAVTQTFNVHVLAGTDPTQMMTSEEVQQASALALAVSASRSVGTRIDSWLSGGLGAASVAPDGSSLTMPLTADGSAAGGAFPSLWLRAGEQQLSNTLDTLSWDGEMSETQVGFDGQIGDRLLIGLMLSQSEGDFDYLDSSDATLKGDYSTETQMLSYYLAWAVAGGTNAWFMVSVGDSEVSTLGQTDEQLDTEFNITTTLSGLDFRLLSGRVTTLRFKAEVANLSFDHLGAIAGQIETTEDTQSRASLQSTHRFRTAGGATWAPSWQLAMRDNLLGSGTEIGASLSYLSAGGRFGIEIGGRTMEADNFEETGAWLSLRLKVAADLRGLSFSLTPASGITASRADALWHKAAEPLHQRNGGADNSLARMSAEIGYGLSTGARSTLTPYSKWEQSASRTRRALGLRWQTGTHFQLSLESHRQQSDTTHPDQGLQLRGKLSF